MRTTTGPTSPTTARRRRGRGGRVRGARREPAAARPAGRRSCWPCVARARRGARGRRGAGTSSGQLDPSGRAGRGGAPSRSPTRLVGQRRRHAARGRGDHRRRPGLPRATCAYKGDGRLPGRRLRPAQENIGGLGRRRRAAGRPLPARVGALHRARGPHHRRVPGGHRRRHPRLRPRRARRRCSPAARSARPRSIPPRPPASRASCSPTRYQVEPGQGEQAALTRMAEQFDAVAAEIGLVDRAAAARPHPLRDRDRSPR